MFQNTITEQESYLCTKSLCVNCFSNLIKSLFILCLAKCMSVCATCVRVYTKYMCLEMLKTDGQSKTKKKQAEIVKGWDVSQFAITKGTT